MQVFVLLLIMALMVHGQMPWAADPPLPGLPLNSLVLGMFAVLAGVEWLLCRRLRRALDASGTRPVRAFRRHELAQALLQQLTLAGFLIALFGLGWRHWLEATLGDLYLINDLIALSLPLGVIVFGWWSFYPVDRVLRERALDQALESERDRWPIRTRAYVFTQVRQQLLLMLGPTLILLAWVQAVRRITNHWPEYADYSSALTLAGGLSVFLFAPLVMRHLWDTIPLPEGDVHRRLRALCETYGIKVRSLLLWRTHSGMINGAVMGLVGRLRYILLTDGLIERMAPEHIEAVMAHEIGHVRYRHVPLMAMAALATLGVIDLLIGLGREAGMRAGLESFHQSGWPDVLHLVLLILGWIAVFGWISRRFERQADTFAVQHLSRDSDVITEHAVGVFTEALRGVARLNYMAEGDESDRGVISRSLMQLRHWRHGTIAWRLQYLKSLTGTPTNACRIDRIIRHLAWIAILTLVGLGVMETGLL